MGSMDDNVEDKRSQIQPIKIKINLAKKQVMSMDEYWEEGEEVKGLEKDSKPMCPHPQVSPPTPTNSLSNCVKDEYGEKAEEVKSQEKACKPHASPPIDQSLLIYFLSQMQVPVTGPNGQATLQTVQVHLAEQFP